FQAELLAVAGAKVANADIYTHPYAKFVQAFEDVAMLPGMDRFFFIDGGALAVENAMKAAFDWKVRKNLAAGRGELGSKIIHFREAFHGRTGYTMSVTNTDPNKVMYFPKFDWPRISNPKLDFNLDEPERTSDVIAREEQAIREIHAAIEQHGHDIAGLLLEPIQCEGGDNHFRGEFLRQLRDICDQHEMLLLFDEVQTGVGVTGKMWCCEHFDVTPDVIAFGKKMQTCGIMAGPRLSEVDSVFKVSSRINSTWGGNLVDMVRATRILRVIEEENLAEHAATQGEYLLDGLHRLAEKHSCVTNVRGRGLLCAIDVPNGQMRNAIRDAAYDRQMMILTCGERSLRLRPVLDVSTEDLSRGLEILDEAIGAVAE
ncbi:MAG: L-lysine 6-transaminase, partial [Phycisphaerales bacterium]|nr:L-lysine 6-transaminase [Phycisphaerales bacterium]